MAWAGAKIILDTGPHGAWKAAHAGHPPEGGGPPGQLTTPRPHVKDFFCSLGYNFFLRGPLFGEGADFFLPLLWKKNHKKRGRKGGAPCILPLRPLFLWFTAGPKSPLPFENDFVKSGFNVIVGARAQRATIYALNPYLTNVFEVRQGGPPLIRPLLVGGPHTDAAERRARTARGPATGPGAPGTATFRPPRSRSPGPGAKGGPGTKGNPPRAAGRRPGRATRSQRGGGMGRDKSRGECGPPQRAAPRKPWQHDSGHREGEPAPGGPAPGWVGGKGRAANRLDREGGGRATARPAVGEGGRGIRSKGSLTVTGCGHCFYMYQDKETPATRGLFRNW